VQSIQWERTASGGDVVITGNGVFPADRINRSHLVGPARELIRISGISQAQVSNTIKVGGAGVAQIRIGLHRQGAIDQLHVVLDLAGADVQVSGVDAQANQLRIHVRSGS
jgi:hypothetical protein